MKNFSLSTFLGLCVLGVCLLVGLVFSGWIIAQELPDTTQIPDMLAIQPVDQQNQSYGDYLSLQQAASYLGVRETDIEDLMQSGELEGIYTKIDRYYIFSKAKLQQWVDKRIVEGQP